MIISWNGMYLMVNFMEDVMAMKLWIRLVVPMNDTELVYETVESALIYRVSLIMVQLINSSASLNLSVLKIIVKPVT